jgi:hypothetical protein
MILGTLQKMRVEAGHPVAYELRAGTNTHPLNSYLGKKVELRFTGKIHCLECDRKTSKSFGQGYCFPCFQRLAACDSCIVKPELCHHHLGTCREPEWGLSHCFVNHVIYLANSTGVKVGITREHQRHTRWMDQGAVQALPIARVKNRLDSGKIEKTLAATMADKTNWRKLVSEDAAPLDLEKIRDNLFESWPENLPGERLTSESVESFTYPVQAYPPKIQSFNLDKNPLVEGTLIGLKGQYWLLDKGVINIRKWGGYVCEFKTE